MLRHMCSVIIPLSAALALSGCTRQVSYSSDVVPILEKHCLSCHVPGKKGHEASGFSMQTYEEFMKGTSYGPVIVPGSGFSSTLAILIEHRADPSINMPHKKQPLSEEEIETVKIWIDQGALNN